jgi:hypothetical protein
MRQVIQNNGDGSPQIKMLLMRRQETTQGRTFIPAADG